jgi:hypothetical protein
MELTEEKKKENIRIMNELREEREREQAHKGLILLIILTIVGVVGAAAFSVFFSGAFGMGFKEEAAQNGFFSFAIKYAPIFGVIMGISALPLAAPIKQIKGITRLFFVLGFILSLFPGIPLLLQKDGNVAVSAVLLVVSIASTLAVVFLLSTSESINMYNKYGND